MRSLKAVLGVAAVAALAVGSAYADGYLPGMSFIRLTNYGNGGGGLGPAFQPGGWTATTNGALWIKTGSGDPVLNTQDVSFQLDFRTSSSQPWTTITGAYILGPTNQGPAVHDVNWSGNPAEAYPGYWWGCDGNTGSGNSWPDSTSPYRLPDFGDGIYYLPGTLNATIDAQKLFQFDLYTWTGAFGTYSQAVGGGAQVAHSGAFQATGLNTDHSGLVNSTAFFYMPSLVLQKGGFPGDANLDGKVDIADLSVLLTNFDKSGLSWGQGDFTSNGVVGIEDLSILLTNFDKTATASAGIRAVPEPSMLLLAVVGLAGLLACARRNRS
jgi:hypothetical protein